MTGWIVETLIASTLLMAIVLLLRVQIAAIFGARVVYLLWLLPALRMVLPPLPRTLIAPPFEQIPAWIDVVRPASIEPFVGSGVAPDIASGIMPAAGVAAAAPAPDAAGSMLTILVDAMAGLPWAKLALCIWLTGAVLHFGWHLIAYSRFVRHTLARSTPLPALDRDGIEVCSSRSVEGPFAAGLFVKTIVLPHDWRWRYTEQELRLALRHEFIHHLRWDMSANFAGLMILSLHWFNPVAHRAWRAFRADQELACDALVLADATPSERHSYGLAVVKSATARIPVSACTLGTRDELKRRLRMMKSGRTSLRRTVSGIALATILVGAGLAMTASGGVAAEVATEVVQPIRTAWVMPPEAPDVPEIAEAPEAPEAPDVPDAPNVSDMPDAPDVPDVARIAAVPQAPAMPAPPQAPAMPAPPQAPAQPEPHSERHATIRILHGDEASDAADAAERAGIAAEREARRAEREAERSAAIAERAAERASQPSERAMRRTTIRALEKARLSLINAPGLQREHLREALAGLDAELEELRAESFD